MYGKTTTTSINNHAIFLLRRPTCLKWVFCISMSIFVFWLLHSGAGYTMPKSTRGFENYECQSNEAKIYHPKYDTVSGEFLGLFQTLGYLTVWGDSGECFLGYGYREGNSKILYSHYKMKILNSFLGSMFYRHRIQFESILNTDSSNIYFFLHSTTDRVEDINKYMGSVN